jgi:hypothetical protein
VSDRLGATVSHLVNGPSAAVLAYVTDVLFPKHPTLRVVSSVEQHKCGILEMVLHRTG